MINQFKFAFLAFMLCHGMHAWAEAPSVTVGTQKFFLPELPNLMFVRDTVFLKEWEDAFVEPSARLLAFMTEKNSPGLKTREFDRYIAIKSMRHLDNTLLSKENNRELLAALRKSTANMKALMQKSEAEMSGREDRISKALDVQVKNMSIGTPQLLEVHRDDEEGYGYTYLARFQADMENQPRSWVTAACTNSFLLKGKFVVIVTYSLYRNEKDLVWVKRTCRDLANGFLSGNR